MILIELTQFYVIQKTYRIIFLLLWQTSWNVQCWRLSQGQQQFKNSKNMIWRIFVNTCIVFLIALFCSKQGNGNYKALVFTRWWIQTSESMPNSWIIFDCGIHWSTLFKFECNVCNCAEWCFDGIFIWCGISWFMVRNFLLVFFCGKGNT